MRLEDKYKPKTLKDIVGNDELIKQLRNIQDGILMYGSPGRGKTSIARAYAYEIYGEEMPNYYLEINGSQQKLRGIGAVSEVIIPFLKNSSLDGRKKILFVDEMDGFTEEAQSALRKPFEDYRDNCIVILACNNIEQIIQAIIDRYHAFQVTVTPEEILERLKAILQAEGKDLPEQILKACVTSCGSSVRKAIQNLEEAMAGRTEFKKTNSEQAEQMFKLAMSGNFSQAVNIKVNDVRNVIKEIYELAISYQLPDSMKGEIAINAAIYSDRAYRGYADVQLAGFIASLIEIGKKYRKL